MDVVVHSGRVVTEKSIVRADIGIRDGEISEISSAIPGGKTRLSAAGAYVLPGGVDAHTHLNSRWPPFDDPRPPVDDFESGTRAAVAGGVTTVCDFVYQLESRSLEESVSEIRAEASRSALTDFAFHVVIEQLEDAVFEAIGAFVWGGFPSIKFYTNSDDYVRNPADYMRLMQRIGAAGGTAMFHCEDDAVAAFCGASLKQAGRTSTRFYGLSRPPEVELAATERALHFAALAGVPAYLVHVSLSDVVDLVVARRRNGQKVYLETRPLYLYLTEELFAQDDREAAKYVGTPPLRRTHDRDRLWAGMRRNQVDVVATDHVGFKMEDKYHPGDTFDDVPRGVANLETMIPMLFSEGVRQGRISLRQLVRLVSTNPAKLFGLFPRKGVIAVGSDADLCVLDPETTAILQDTPRHSASDYEVYAGRRVSGWPRYTLSRGELVFAEGAVLAEPGRGQFVPGSPGGGLA